MITHSAGKWSPDPNREIDRRRIVYAIALSSISLFVPFVTAGISRHSFVAALIPLIPSILLITDWQTLKKKAKPLQAIADRQRGPGWIAVDLEIKIDGCTLGSDSGILSVNDGMLRYEGVRADFAISNRGVNVTSKPSSVRGRMKSVLHLKQGAKTYDLEFVHAQNFEGGRSDDTLTNLKNWTQGAVAREPESFPPLVIQRELIVREGYLRAPLIAIGAAVWVAVGLFLSASRLREPWRFPVLTTLGTLCVLTPIFAVVVIVVQRRRADCHRRNLGTTALALAEST